MKNKISFDFDSTLSESHIQRYAKSLIETNLYDVYIITSRCSGGYGFVFDNNDLFEVADKVGIDRDHVIFTQMKYKYKFITDDFIFHLDDDVHERRVIMNVPAIDATNINCIDECNRVLSEYHNG